MGFEIGILKVIQCEGSRSWNGKGMNAMKQLFLKVNPPKDKSKSLDKADTVVQLVIGCVT